LPLRGGDGGGSTFGDEGDGGGPFGEEDDTWLDPEPPTDEPEVDVPALAAWLIAELEPAFLEEFMSDLSIAVYEFADTPVGEDLAVLLYHLQQE